MNIGKVFESCIKESVPEYALIYRLPDSAQSFGGNDRLRFSRKSPFDFLIWDSIRHRLFALEMKTVAGKSISFERNKSESKEIHFHQIEGLKTWDAFDGITCGFVIEFRELEKTIFIRIKDFENLINIIDKKSFTIEDIESNSIPYLVIEQEKKKTRYKYNIDKFLSEIKD